MYKWIYDRMVSEYSKETKEELIQRIMALDEIECEDRCFANQCEAGTSIYNINNLFELFDTLKRATDNPNITDTEIANCARIFCSSYDNAKSSWNYIKNGISEMNDNTRCDNKLNDFKLRVSNAKNSNDNI